MRSIVLILIGLHVIQAHASKEHARIESAKNNLLEVESKKRNVLAELYDIKKKMKAIEKERQILTTKKTSAESHIRSISQLIVELSKKVRKQKQRLKDRVRVLYKFGGQGFLRLAFSSEDSSKMDRNLKYLSLMSKHDLRSIENFQDNIRILRSQRVSLSKKKLKLKGIASGILSRSSELEAEMSRRSKLLNSIESQKILELARLKKLRLEGQSKLSSKGVKSLALLREVLDPAFFELRGRLNWPVKGTISKDFGRWTVQPEKVELRSSGVLIQSEVPQVKSVYRGIVSYVGYVPGFGKTVILNHGDRYHTVYSNLDKYVVKRGMKVDSGDELGSLKSMVEKRALHFEVRHFSEPMDPKNWLSKNDI